MPRRKDSSIRVVPAAAVLINASRTKNGLPAITALDNTSPVPGGANCVPK
jgi:hypothetical protein